MDLAPAATPVVWIGGPFPFFKNLTMNDLPRVNDRITYGCRFGVAANRLQWKGGWAA